MAWGLQSQWNTKQYKHYVVFYHNSYHLSLCGGQLVAYGEKGRPFGSSCLSACTPEGAGIWVSPQRPARGTGSEGGLGFLFPSPRACEWYLLKGKGWHLVLPTAATHSNSGNFETSDHFVLVGKASACDYLNMNPGSVTSCSLDTRKIA